MSISFYRQLADALNAGAVVVATVMQCRGSVPREVGAKLFVDCQGRCVGTIGGGAGEAKVIQQATLTAATGQKQWVEINLSGSPQHHAEGICGGVMQVWLERWQGDAALALVQKILAQLEAGRSIAVVTPLTQARSPYLAGGEEAGGRRQLFLLAPNPVRLSARRSAYVEAHSPCPRSKSLRKSCSPRRRY